MLLFLCREFFLRPSNRRPLQTRGAAMYNNYLSCEVCKTELTRQNQKQYLDAAGYMHSFCSKCYDEKGYGQKAKK
jgi:hypothetical protein